MRIGFDGRWYGHSGVGNYVSELLEAMGTINEDIEIILYEDPTNPLAHIKADRIRRVPIDAQKYSVQEQIELPRKCRADRLDVFHSPFYVTPWFAPCPVVVTIHDVIPFLFKIYSLPKEKVIRLGYRLGVLKAARVIADSENTAADLNRVLGVPEDKVRAVHLATSRDSFHPRQAAGEAEYLAARYGVRPPYVLTLSAKNWRTKNLATVLRALAVSRRQTQRQFQTVVFGSSEGFREASKQISAGAENNNIVIPGFVPSSDLAKLYRCAEVFLLGSTYEGFGLPLLEAMSCGCPVVCSNGGSLREVAGEGAVLVNPQDHVQMGDAVARLLNDRGELSQQRTRALKRAADFSWERAAKRTVSVYAEAAKLR